MPENIQTPADPHLTVSAAAQFLGVSPWTLRNWDRSGKLRPMRHPVNGYRMYRRYELEAILRSDDLPGQRASNAGTSRAEQRLRMEHTVADLLAGSASPQEAARQILQVICEHLGWHVGIQWQVDRDQGVLRCAHVYHVPEPPCAHFTAACRQITFPAGVGLPGTVWASRTAKWIPDLAQDGSFVRASAAAAEGLNAALGVPIIVNGDVQGVMEFISHAILEPHEDQLQMMVAIGNQLGQFIERKRAEAALGESRQRLMEEVQALNELHQLSVSLSSAVSLPEALEEVLRASTAISGTPMGLLQLWDPAEGVLKIVAHRGLPQTYLELFGVVRPEEPTACCMAMQSRRAVFVGDVESDPAFGQYSEVAASAGFRAVHCTPLLSRAGETLGVLSVYFAEPRRPSERDQRILDLYCRHAANLIERIHDEEARAWLAAIVASSDDAIIGKDLDGTITTWNAAAGRLFGYSSEEAVGQPITILIPPDRTSEEQTILERMRRRERVQHYETVRRRKDGSLIDISLSVSPVLDGSGRVIGASKIARDITRQKQTEQALRESGRRYRSLLSMLPAAVYTCEAPSGVITFFNDHAAQLWGRSPKLQDTEERFCGSVRLWQPDGSPLPHDQTPMAIALREGRSFRNQELVVERPDGTRLTVLVNIDPILDSSGQTVGAINVFHDTTALRQAEEALRTADRRKDEFLATLAHELRNPLAPLRNSLQILRMTEGSNPAVQPIHEMMERQITNMVRLVDDLLELSRISRGAIELRRENVSLTTVIGNAVETSQPIIDAAGHQLEVSLPAEPIFVHGDMVRLVQVFTNLLNNAAKYTDRGGRIEVVADRQGDTAVVSVRDSGIGIPPDMLPRVFDMFAQVKNSLRGIQEGLGIGLSLVRTIVQMHGGKVAARSEGLGRGSEFIVRLPVAQVAGPVPSGLPGGEVSGRVPPASCIVVVDDNRDSASSLAMLLKLLGADVRVAYDGGSALEVIRTCRPSAALLDIGMPGMDGYQVAEQIRKDPQLGDTMLIALTGWGQDEDRRRSREAGFDHHLVKPVELDVLQSLLASLDGKQCYTNSANRGSAL